MWNLSEYIKVTGSDKVISLNNYGNEIVCERKHNGKTSTESNKYLYILISATHTKGAKKKKKKKMRRKKQETIKYKMNWTR